MTDRDPTLFRSAYTRSKWLRQNYRPDLPEEEKAALLVEYHRGAPAPEEETHER